MSNSGGRRFFSTTRLSAVRRAAPRGTTTNQQWEQRKTLARRYVPYIPPQFVVETVQFLQSKNNVRSLLDIIFSPRSPRDEETDRRTYTRTWERYKEEKRLHNAPYRLQEKYAEQALWRAVNALPQDLHAEAARPMANPLPLALRFHRLYRRQLLLTLSDYEQRCLQTFQNLMHVRFPFNEARHKHPELFWITQLGSIHRARLATLSKSLIKWKD